MSEKIERGEGEVPARAAARVEPAKQGRSAANDSTDVGLEVLVSTCNERIAEVPSMLLAPSPGVRWLVVHQLFGEQRLSGLESPRVAAALAALHERDDVTVVRSHTRGLAVSRNVALDSAVGDVVLVADDDVTYSAEMLQKISAAFAEKERFAALSFRIETPDGVPFRRYPDKPYEHDRITAFRIASVELAMRREAVTSSGVRFDERFGLGAEFPSCEETVFVSDMLTAGLAVGYVPRTVVVHPAESSGSNWASVDARRLRGALFRRVFGVSGLPLLLIFAIKQRPNYREHIGLIGFLRQAIPAYFRFSGGRRK